MSPLACRQHSWEVVRQLGLRENPELPLLDPARICHSLSELVGRLLVMSAAAFCVYGFDRARALAWLKRERCTRFLVPAEQEFLEGDDSHKTQMFWQIQGVWVLCWAVGGLPELDLTAKHAPNTLARAVPNVPKDEPAGPFRAKAKLRPAREVISKCDLAYCLHWALRDARLNRRRPRRAPPYEAVYERRRALEWLLCDEEWDEVPMDT